MNMKHITASVVVVAVMLGALAVRAPALVPGGDGRIVFASDFTGQLELYTVAPDGSDPKILTHSAPGLETSHPAWSPDGEWIAFNRDNQAGVDVWLIDRAGHRERQVTHLDSVSAEPAWSPDGRRIVFQHLDDATGHQDLYTIRPDGSDLVRVTNTPDADEVLASFSPDGKWLAYGYISSSGTNTISHVRVSRADGSQARDITPDALNGGRPGWSPDGRRIVFSSNNAGQIGVGQELWTIAPDGSHLHRLTSATTGSGDTFPTYAPNGRSIAFESDRSGGQTDIFVMRADGTDVRDITPDAVASGETDPDWRTR